MTTPDPAADNIEYTISAPADAAEPQPTDPREVRRCADAADLAATVATDALELIASALEERGEAHIVLTGGSSGIAVVEAAARHPRAAELPWERVTVYFGDERFVPAGHVDRNDAQAAAVWDAHRPSRPTVVAVATADGPQSIDEAARTYATALPTRFDLHLLGVGPDGHVNSLFPSHPQLEVTRAVVAVTDSPKPPRQRVTLTLPSIATARHAWLLAAGQPKAAAVAEALGSRPDVPPTDRPLLPAARARGAMVTRWYIDDASAADLDAAN